MANYPLLGKYTSINPINKTRFICEVPKKNPIQPPKKDQNNLWLFNKHSYHPPPKKKILWLWQTQLLYAIITSHMTYQRNKPPP